MLENHNSDAKSKFKLKKESYLVHEIQLKGNYCLRLEKDNEIQSFDMQN